MKPIEIEKVTKVTHYEAIDGTTFTTKEECAKYEESAKCVLLSRYKGMIVKQTNEYAFYKTGSDEIKLDIVKLKNSSSVNIIMQLYYYYNTGEYAETYTKSIEESCARALEEADFLIIYRGDEYEDGFWVRGTRNELFEHINSICNETNKA
jgi:hypothetical protein